MSKKNQSHPVSRWLKPLRIVLICYWIFLTLLLWAPDPRAFFGGWDPPEGPQGYAHLMTFSLLGFLVELGRRVKSLPFWGIILVGYTFLTEIVQHVLPPRTFGWEDVFQDLCGIFLGLAFGYFVKLVFLPQSGFPSQNGKE